MGDKASIAIGRDASGNVLVAGGGNTVRAELDVQLIRTELPSAHTVDIVHELDQIRAILKALSSGEAGKVGRALDDAAEEARKPQPDREEIGTALGRALDYAKKASGFADQIQRLAPHVARAVGWLGNNWHKLLPPVGLSV